MANNDLHLTNYFTVEDILPHVGEMSRDEILHRLVPNEDTFNAVLEREALGSTVIKDGLAIPHARVSTVTRPKVAIATSGRGIIWPGEKNPVHIVFLLLIPQSQPALYLQILRALGTALADNQVLHTVANMANAADVYRFFESGKAYLPRYITAADIMDREFLTLHETDTLQTCVDTFINNKVSEVAVLDRDNDLRGLVRAGELLRICLPEYLLWMDDLTPIANFEPFAHVLENERKTWLREIMVTDFPCVAPDVPAVQVAGEMTRHHSNKCYVKEGNKLVGVVRMSNFLNKIFRE